MSPKVSQKWGAKKNFFAYPHFKNCCAALGYLPELLLVLSNLTTLPKLTESLLFPRKTFSRNGVSVFWKVLLAFYWPRNGDFYLPTPPV